MPRELLKSRELLKRDGTPCVTFEEIAASLDPDERAVVQLREHPEDPPTPYPLADRLDFIALMARLRDIKNPELKIIAYRCKLPTRNY